ncbi:toxin ParE1/3/4 [Parabacteroides sp. PF5-5]|uniref:type II toxin-antitoxin system RelE/ParE family toxin n=1 Tax=unclassified Parabacteroides TaxID=2649774 RepID=UPI002474685A|nr:MULTISPECIES: type II toxin-antitoxin system RelE/ParE family toxin [unclassified Parabacteroides]MDH6303862.1 toxin ParE1/3/4 [Parabacteroides sp. PH5-39]MDH6314479.1 toxin ParE1/3/4 [Parabacteroides sp. PF5-13]MDH6318456.1 toxin ParE1/3/4 [Parabacteroides sp. PH5-13]MDH6322251.1 toxin ParE1/3/4 [Parabacteroides sp. PH5-8]MDH6325669.1 toxin ParE1/3/4 [Parabacteroides sp. PH5-41]
MIRYIISEEARRDIENIWLYTLDNWSLEQADRYYNLIIDEIEYISVNFEAGRDFSNIREGYRYSKVKSHLIFYKKSKDGKVEIIRILHERMDIENRLNN